MGNKDKVIGLVIMLVAILLIVFYTLWGPVDLYMSRLTEQPADRGALAWFYSLPAMNWEYAVVLPMWLVVVLVGIIAIWIGFSMVTTPPPVPLEELEEELEAEEAASNAANN
jgi:fatty acid desaturase